MPVVTVNSIRDGLIAALDAKFPSIAVTGEEVHQGLDENPYFFVGLVLTQHAGLLGRRARRTHTFDIHYFHPPAAGNRPLHDMAERLYGALTYIAVDGSTYRSSSMQHQITEGVLHFFVEFSFHVLRRQEPEDKMQTMTHKGGLK